MEMEDGSDVAREPDHGGTISRGVVWLAAFTGAVCVVMGVMYGLAFCCSSSCWCQGVPWFVLVVLGAVVATGCGIWAILALRLCCG